MSRSPDHHEAPNGIATRISKLFWRISPSCKEVSRLSSEECDHPLSISSRLQIRLHRRFCVWCARYAQQIDFVNEATHDLPEHLHEIEGGTLDNDAKARLKSALRDKKI